jgi:hypothetical protein
MYGHFLSYFYPSEEALYAMVGAACVMSGATHSISSAIIIFELTGQSSYLIPMLTACLIANLTAQSLSMSFFDVILLLKNLPHLPSIKTSLLYNLSAKDVMSTDVYQITNFTYINTMELSFNIPDKQYDTIPILNEEGIIQYTVKTRKIVKYLETLYESYKLNYENDVGVRLGTVINHLGRKFGKKHSSFFGYLNAKFKKNFMTSKELQKRKEAKKERIKFEREEFVKIKECKILFF